MRKRPFSLLVFSILMVIIAISLPLQVIYLQDFENLFQSLTILNILIMFQCVLTGIAAYKLHKSFYFLLPLVIMSVLYNNWWVGSVGIYFNLFETSLASFGFLGLCTLLLEKNTFKVLCNPKLKWWDMSQRTQIEIPVLLSPTLRGDALIKKSFDISESGFFLQGLENEEFDRIKIGEKFSVCFYFTRILKIRCAAKIVRKTSKNGTYPAGIGLQFVGIDEQIKANIKKLCQINNEAFF